MEAQLLLDFRTEVSQLVNKYQPLVSSPRFLADQLTRMADDLNNIKRRFGKGDKIFLFLLAVVLIGCGVSYAALSLAGVCDTRSTPKSIELSGTKCWQSKELGDAWEKPKSATHGNMEFATVPGMNGLGAGFMLTSNAVLERCATRNGICSTIATIQQLVLFTLTFHLVWRCGTFGNCVALFFATVVAVAQLFAWLLCSNKIELIGNLLGLIGSGFAFFFSHTE